MGLLNIDPQSNTYIIEDRYIYNGDFMVEIKENVELNKEIKKEFKIIAAQQGVSMRDLLLMEAKTIIANDDYVPIREREDEDNRSSLIINIPTDFKDDIRLFVSNHEIKIRDLWVESVDRIIKRHNEVLKRYDNV